MDNWNWRIENKRGTITGYGSKHSHEFKLTVNETSTNITNNTSDISFNFTIYKASYSWSQWNSITYTITINGTSYTGTIPSYSAGSTMTIRSGTQTVGHNTDGTKNINYSFSVNDGSGQSYTCGNASASGNMDLTKIPRYANLTKLEVKSRTINSITLSYTTDRPSWLFVNLNNGEDWLNDGEPFKSDTTSGEFTIYYKDKASTKRLDVNTSYRITVLCRALNRDSNLDTTKDITVSTYDIAKLITIPDVNIGSSQSITWSNPSGATTSLKLCKKDGTTVIDYGTVTGTSKTVTPTASTLYALTPNSNTITLRYIITTAGSYTAYKDCVFTVTNSNPTFNNFEYEDINTITTALTGNSQILVKGYSNVKGIISTSNKATANNSATMKTYKMLIGNKNTSVNYSSNTEVNMTLSSVDSAIIDMYATDSRGNSTKVSKTATIKNYSNIKIISLSATRQSNVGQGVTLKFEAQFWNDSFGSVNNSITNCKYNYKLTSESSYTAGTTTLEYTINENKITGSVSIQGDLGANGFNISNSYNIELVIADELSSATYTIILGSGEPAIAVYKNNVAIGQKYDTSTGEKLQVKGNAKVTGTINGYTLKTACERSVKTLTSKTHSNYGVNNDYLPDMAVFAYWNGAYNNSNYSNLTYAHQGTIQCKPTTLYDNSSGTTGTITLSQTSANFTYLEIFYKNNVGSNVYQSQKIYSPNGKYITFNNINNVNNTITQISWVSWLISGTSMKNMGECFINVNKTAGTVYWGNATELHNYVVKVIGYK